MPPSLNSHESLVLKSALASRFLLVALVVLWRSLLDPYDTSATLNPNCLSSTLPSSSAEKSVLWLSLGSAIESNIVWDSVYYVRIAQCGYEYEQTYAFFPLLPFLISISSRTVLLPLVPVIGYRAVLGLSGYLISNIAFVFAAVYFYSVIDRLSVIILKDKKASLRASILFCFNPASIFYTSIYSESLYALFSIGGVYHWFSGAQSIAILWLAVSGFARSNGMLNAGYICFHTMLRVYEALINKKRASLAMQAFAVGILRCVFIFIPFISFQAFGYYNMCHGQNFDDIRPWCRGRIPTMYNYIQGHYWGVGFLKYFHLKQMPNFLVASPILTLTVCSILTYARTWSKLLFSLGLQASLEEMSAEFLLRPVAYSREKTCSPDNMSSTDTETRHLRRRKQVIGRAKPSTQVKENKFPDKLPHLSGSIFPFIVHLGFMGATALFVMHVQVATRFLSASAPLYWFAAYLMISPSSQRWGYLIWAYCVAYILLGSLLFSNFYPFT